MSLHTRWNLIVGAVGFAACLVMLAVTRGILQSSAHTASRHWVANAADNAEAILLDGIEDELGLVAGMAEACEASDGSLAPVLDRALQDHPSLRYTLRMPDGAWLGGSGCVAEQPSRGDLVGATCDGIPALALVVPLAEGRVLTLAHVLDDAFVRDLASLTLTEVLLVAPDGTTSSTFQDLEGHTYTPELMPIGDDLALAPAEGASFGRATLTGAPYAGFEVSGFEQGSERFEVYVGALRMSPTGHHILVVIPTVAMDITTTYTTGAIAAGTILTTIVTVGLLTASHRRLTSPLRELVAATERVERGDLSARVHVSGDDEIGRLAATFNQMVVAMRELNAVSRLNGMAEVATGVLHNVGNVLTSVVVSTDLIRDRTTQLRTGRLVEAAELLTTHQHDLVTFLADDPRGRVLPTYLVTAARALDADRADLLEEIGALRANVDRVKSVVAMQQAYARTVSNRQLVPIEAILEDALEIVGISYANHEIRVVRDLAPTEPIVVDPIRVAHVLVNVLQNAKDAILAAPGADRTVTIRTRVAGERLRIEIADTGVGIAADELERIFHFGHTTKPDGHGFGLHMSAVAAQEMGGHLAAASPGLGAGATFTFELPLTPRAESA